LSFQDAARNKLDEAVKLSRFKNRYGVQKGRTPRALRDLDRSMRRFQARKRANIGHPLRPAPDPVSSQSSKRSMRNISGQGTCDLKRPRARCSQCRGGPPALPHDNGSIFLMAPSPSIKVFPAFGVYRASRLRVSLIGLRTPGSKRLKERRIPREHPFSPAPSKPANPRYPWEREAQKESFNPRSPTRARWDAQKGDFATSRALFLKASTRFPDSSMESNLVDGGYAQV